MDGAAPRLHKAMGLNSRNVKVPQGTRTNPFCTARRITEHEYGSSPLSFIPYPSSFYISLVRSGPSFIPVLTRWSPQGFGGSAASRKRSDWWLAGSSGKSHSDVFRISQNL